MSESYDSGISMKDIWSKLSKEVMRTFLHVDIEIQENKLWLYSSKCDLNDLQKSILQAFNIDIRKTFYDSKDITIIHKGITFVCQNGIFMKEVKTIQPEKGINPCFGEFSLIVNKPKQVSLRCESDLVHFMTLDRFSFAESLKDMAKKKVDKLVRFLETVPCFSEQPRGNLEYFSKQM